MITNIKLTNFRNYKEMNIDISSPTIIFQGSNGSGKTNILESIYFISMLRSFRTSKISELKKVLTKNFSVSIEIEKNKKWHSVFEANYGRNRILKIDNNPINKASEFIKNIKTVLFSPNDIRIISDSSSVRRKFLNIFLSMIEPNYFFALKNYSVALQIRNKLLRTQSQDLALIKAYEPILAQNSVTIMDYREEYLSVLANEINNILKNFTTLKFDIVYKRQKKTSTINEYMEKFEIEREYERKKGFSTFGEQIDDFNFIYNNLPLRQFGSMGQCRLIALCLKMAEMNILCKQNSNKNIIALIDDVTGELDKKTEDFFYDIVNQAEQKFITFTDIPSSPNKIINNAQIFNINDGKIILNP